MQCVKTGAHVFLEEYGSWVYGDAFQYGGALFVNAVYAGHDPARPVKHYTAHRIDHWFNESRTSEAAPSVLVVAGWSDHGYDGVAI